MTRPLKDIIAHIRAVAANPSVSTTLIQTEDLLALCNAAEGNSVARSDDGPSPFEIGVASYWRARRGGDTESHAIELAVSDVMDTFDGLTELIAEVVGPDGAYTDAAYAAELPSRLAESGWFKRARAALT